MIRSLLALLLVCTYVSGCVKKSKPVVRLDPLVAWPDVGGDSSERVADGFVNLMSGGTDGLFPASIAVARVTICEGCRDQPRRVVLDMAPPNDFLPFNSLFDTLPYVADAFPLGERDLAGYAALPARLCSAAKELSAGLCLVYGRGDESTTESRIRGVLYDAGSGAPLATIGVHTEARDPKTVPHPPDTIDDDLGHCDARVLADRRFEQLVYECVRDLREGDRPVHPQPQEGWTPQGPIFPRTWPPPVNGKP